MEAVRDTMFTLPLSDDNPTRHLPFVTWTVIAGCIAVFLWQTSLGPRAGQAIVYSLGVIPAVLFGSAQLPPDLRLVPAPVSVVTSMFSARRMDASARQHALSLDFWEQCWKTAWEAGGSSPSICCAVLPRHWCSRLRHPASEIPMIGASGAIGGVLGAYLVLHPPRQCAHAVRHSFLHPGRQRTGRSRAWPLVRHAVHQRSHHAHHRP